MPTIVALLAVLLASAPRVARAMDGASVVINEVVAANDTLVDGFGDTPDWIELQNNGAEPVDLIGWTIADNGGPWTFPSTTIEAGQRLLIFASGRDLSGAELHTDFALKRSGETITLANADGELVDSLTYPELSDDVSYGRDPSGSIGMLVVSTPGQPNSELVASSVSILTPPQTFVGSLTVTMAAVTRSGEEVRYTTNGAAVTESSPTYDGPFEITSSTVVRAAVVGGGQVSPETSAAYVAVSVNVADFSSDIPVVLVHAAAGFGPEHRDAIVSVIDRGEDGRVGVFDPADYTGFAGMRIRGGSSTQFDKKQYKLELWRDRLGDEIDADLLGLGRDSDWGLYAPGRYDRAMINNPFMYELGKRVGVVSPDYQFVEVFIAEDGGAAIDDSDYRGLYVLRESIKVGDQRVDIAEHSAATAGPDGGFIVRYDSQDPCCRDLTPVVSGRSVSVDTPKATDITPSQFDYISGWWSEVIAAAETRSYAEMDPYIDFDSLIDGWLLEMLAMDIDVLRASHYFHKDAGGQLRAGPLWDYDRAMGADDFRIDEIGEAQSWKPNGPSGHSYEAALYSDLWRTPEVQAQLRARWAELRAPGAALSNAELESLIFAMGNDIAEAYGREDARWGSNANYGSRFGDLNGELAHLRDWLLARTGWLDDQFLSDAGAPTVTVPDGGIEITTNSPVSYQVQASDSQAMFFAATGLPEGLTIDEATGLITGTVAFGDSYGTFAAQVTVTNSSGASTTSELLIADPAFALPPSSSVVLNEFNAVAPGQFLGDGGDDSSFGRVGGNGGDWFEVVTIDDRLDLRGWRFDVWSNSDLGRVVQSASLVLGQDELLSDLRAGTIITVAESVPDDLSYDPVAGDWTINLQSNNAADGALWANQTGFDTNHKKWRLVIRDAAGAIQGYIGGETAAFDADGVGNLNSSQVLTLADDPAATATDYRQRTASTFGAPNVTETGVQDFAALRPQVVAQGDVNCSGSLNVADALVIAQYSVGLRTDGGQCPLADAATQIHYASADVNDDSQVNVIDALLVAQCTVDIPNVFCPE